MKNQNKLIAGLSCIGLALAIVPAHATLQILNGDFSLNPTQGNNPVDWYVPTTSTGGSWWTSTWVGPNVSPNGTSVLGLSFMTSTNWAYQNIGVDDNGIGSITLSFDLGSFTDAGSARNLGVTVSLYQGSSFTPGTGLDVNGASGTTLVGIQSVSAVLNPGQSTTEQMTFNLTGVNSTDPLYLRFINYQVDATQPWDAIDNISMTTTPVPEPATLALCGIGGMALMALRRRK